MADPQYPLEAHVKENLEELFERISITPFVSGKAGNIDGKIVNEVLDANVSTKIYHTLRRVPNGFIVLSQSDFGSIKTVASDTNTLTIMANQDMSVKLLIL